MCAKLLKRPVTEAIIKCFYGVCYVGTPSNEKCVVGKPVLPNVRRCIELETAYVCLLDTKKIYLYVLVYVWFLMS